MACPSCGSEELAFPVPQDFRAYLPDDRAGAAVCTRCLAVSPLDDPPADLPDFSGLSDALPRDPVDAAGVVLVLALLDRLALYREEVSELVGRLERSGVDLFLVLRRLRDDPAIEPAMDLDRRERQLEQLLY